MNLSKTIYAATVTVIMNCSTIVYGQADGKESNIVKKRNPVLKGYYADPEILHSKKTGRYYIYPTSDGFLNWSGDSFKVFSSSNLVDWQDEGVIIDLKKDVQWAHENALAPCIIEKKIAGQYKYFYYFTAGKKIGVATSDNPTGPFKDSGRPVIGTRPAGVTRGQEIDPDVFTDPKTNKTYLYWGNAYLAAAELSDDLLSIKPETMVLMTPKENYSEGSYVIYRKGIYYLMWSDGDTRSPEYKVRYATSSTALGPWVTPPDNIVLEQDRAQGIYATGHHSILQVPGTDKWYIVYHRFKYPDGINMGREAGYHREVCIDSMEFTSAGLIKKAVPTHSGISPLK